MPGPYNNLDGIPDFKPGDRMSASAFNVHTHQIRAARSIQVGHGMAAWKNSLGLFITGLPSASGPEIREARVNEVHDDYVVCNLINATGEIQESTVNVAKYPEVRKSEYHELTADGLTYNHDSPITRTVTDADGEEQEQVIVPAYTLPQEGFPGSRLLVIAARIPVVADDGQKLVCDWVEWTNRAWAQVAE